MTPATTWMRYKGDGSTPSDAAVQNRGETGRYLADPKLVTAVNTALAVEQPLLVTGEPGTGKTMLAWSIASELGLGPVLEFHTRSDNQARDTLYDFDYLLRFYHAQTRDARAENLESYIRWQALGEAIRSETPRVVLIDEVDKAPRDFPNDLLDELDRMEFRVPELGLICKSARRPVVVVTSNSERQLPDPFLRRCIFHRIDVPGGRSPAGDSPGAARAPQPRRSPRRGRHAAIRTGAAGAGHREEAVHRRTDRVGARAARLRRRARGTGRPASLRAAIRGRARQVRSGFVPAGAGARLTAEWTRFLQHGSSVHRIPGGPPEQGLRRRPERAHRAGEPARALGPHARRTNSATPSPHSSRATKTRSRASGGCSSRSTSTPPPARIATARGRARPGAAALGLAAGAARGCRGIIGAVLWTLYQPPPPRRRQPPAPRPPVEVPSTAPPPVVAPVDAAAAGGAAVARSAETARARAHRAKSSRRRFLAALAIFWALKTRHATHAWLRDTWASALAAAPGPYHFDLVLRDPPTRLPRADVEDAATILGRTFTPDALARQLDVRRSVRLTLRRGMLPQLVYKPRRTAQPILVLQDVSQDMRIWRPKIDTLLADLARQGVPLDRWYFDGDPRRVADQPFRATVGFETVLRKRPGAPVLIVSTGTGRRIVARHRRSALAAGPG